MADMPLLDNLGESFASQYYGLLCSDDANNMHYFYTENSTMILVINGHTVTTATELNQIHNLILSLKLDTIQTNTVHFLECWGRGVLLVVSGFVKIEDVAEFCKFVHTIYLAPQGNDTDNRNLDESAVKRLELLKSLIKENNIGSRGRSDLQILPDIRKELELVMPLILKDIRSRGRSDIQIQPNVMETPPAQEDASSSNSSSVANADENMDAPNLNSNSQSDTPTTSTSAIRGGGNNTRERDSGGRDKGKKKAEN